MENERLEFFTLISFILNSHPTDDDRVVQACETWIANNGFERRQRRDRESGMERRDLKAALAGHEHSTDVVFINVTESFRNILKRISRDKVLYNQDEVALIKEFLKAMAIAFQIDEAELKFLNEQKTSE